MNIKRWVALAFLGAISVLAYYGVRYGLFAIRPAEPGSTASVIIEIKRGDSPYRIVDVLQKSQVTTSSAKLLKVGQFLGKWTQIKAGEYALSPQQTPLEILQTLTSGQSIQHAVVIPEGKNMYQVASIIGSAGIQVTAEEFVALCKNRTWINTHWQTLGFSGPTPPSLEGFLFPDTYRFTKSVGVEEVAKTILRRFLKEWALLKQDYENSRFSQWSMLAIVTLASIIEKETGAPWERPQISSVFHNRLVKRMRLQSDPTTIYGVWEGFSGNLRRSHLAEKTPYNTYAIAGLPVGPISNPGREAIRAALQPASSDSLFFVSKNDGTHEFTKTLKEHESAVRKFQIDRKAREGKSWRDLDKRAKN